MKEHAEELHRVLQWNKVIYEVIQGSEALGPDACYVGAGCIAQTVWNHQNGNPPLHGISDIDFVYFDDSDVSFEAEGRMIDRVRQAFASCPLPLDVKNQARVHLWYREKFGYDIQPYPSLQAAVATWPTTATAVAVRLEKGKLQVCAPFGLQDLFSQTVRANKAQITREVYAHKVQKWRAFWPSLTIVPW